MHPWNTYRILIILYPCSLLQGLRRRRGFSRSTVAPADVDVSLEEDSDFEEER